MNSTGTNQAWLLSIESTAVSHLLVKCLACLTVDQWVGVQTLQKSF